MQFEKTAIDGVWLIRPEPREDSRGFFNRYFCEKEFGQHALCTRFVQMSAAGNRRRGTLRGLHYQAAPGSEIKTVRCTSGAVFDVVADIRSASPTYKKWISVELTRKNQLALYIPAGLAHGYQTLEDETELLYQMSAFYDPSLDRGLRWSDPAFAIPWPIQPPVLSDRDAALPLLGA